MLSKLDASELRGIGHRIKDLGIDTIAVTSVFSPVNTAFERTAAGILAEAVPDAHVTLSSEIGRLGLLERENAAIMNACLRPLSGEVVAAFRTALAEIGLACPFYFHIFGALGQFERDLIRERTRAGLAAAAARGRTGGRKPVVTEEKLRRAQELVAKGLTGRRPRARPWS